MDFYVYIHRKKTTKEVFYVGKGKGNRAYVKSRRSTYWKNIANKHGYIVEFVENGTGLQEWYALELEQNLISFYGRKNTSDGSLVNLCDGGDVTTDYKHTQEAKNKITKALIGRQVSSETRRKISLANSGRTHPDELKKQWSEKHKGKIISDETRRKISLSHKGKAPCRKAIESAVSLHSKKIKRSDGLIFSSTQEATRVLRSEGKHPKASQSNISMVANGKRNIAYGYTWEFVNNDGREALA